jgi:hypothetical protein
MKIISYNLCGLGSQFKKMEVHRLVGSEKSDIWCVQDSKLEVVPGHLCDFLWDGRPVECQFKASIGQSGGIVSLSNPSVFQASDSFVCSHFIGLIRRWVSKDVDVVLFMSMCLMRFRLERLFGMSTRMSSS